MKMHPEIYAQLLDRTREFMTDENATPYRLANLSSKRFRWDCLWAACDSKWVCDEVYSRDMNDDHLDTALRTAMKEAGLADWTAA